MQLITAVKACCCSNLTAINSVLFEPLNHSR